MTEPEQKKNASIPVPDPTTLTTAALEHEAQILRDSFKEGLASLSKELETAIDHRDALTKAELKTIDVRFDMMEEHRIEKQADVKAAVDAALISQKEAVKEQTIASEKAIAKSESATTESIKQLSTTFAVSIESANRAVNDVKDRVVRMEAQASGNPDRERIVSMESQKAGAKDNTAAIMSAIAVAGVIISIVLSVIAMFSH